MNYSNFANTQYVMGRGSLEKLGEFKDGKIALVVDGAIVKALNFEEKLYNGILAGCDFKVICEVLGEPNMEFVDKYVKDIQEYAPKYIVGIGGGATLDTAKALRLFYELPEYTWEEAMIPYAVKPFPKKSMMIAVPTTSGTGSETTACSVIKDYEYRKKMILSGEILPDLVVMDYDLLNSLPGKNIAYSGTDALAHAFEAAVSNLSNTMIKLYATQAIVTLIKELPKSYKGDMDAREKVHVCATMAGMAINNSITGMAHGMDQAGGDFHLPHGLMTGLILPYTMRYLAPNPVYLEVANQLGIEGDDQEKQDKLIEMIWAMYDEIQMPKTLKEVGVDEAEYLAKIPSYIERAMEDANIMFAPKDPTKEELETIYKQMYYGL